MKQKKIPWLAVLLLVAVGVVAADQAPDQQAEEKAEEKEDEKALASADMVAIAKALRPSLVRVEITLKFDKGQAPEYYGRGGSGETLIREERPLEIPGVLLAEKKVIIEDPLIHPRFIKDIAVTYAGQSVKASISGYGRDETAAFVDLAEPLKGAKPAVFDPKAEPPYLRVGYHRRNGVWTVEVTSLSVWAGLTDRDKQFAYVSSMSLVVDKQGTPVGLPVNGYLPVDDSWKVSPLKWPIVSADDLSKLLDQTKRGSEQGLLRVKLNFRSPRKDSGGFARFRGGDGEERTEQNVIGVLTKDTELMVLASLQPKLTARLERITAYPPQGEPVAAKFAHTLTDYGCFLATLGKLLPGALTLSSRDLVDLEDRLLPSADIRLHGEKQETYFLHNRINGYEIGWKRHLYPHFRTREGGIFLFDTDGALLAVPVARREKVSVQERWRGGDPKLTACRYLKEVFADLAKNVDPSNVPLTEEEENRLAWMGVELQKLDQELARMNKVSHLTNDGQFGAMVSYVYPGSPADKAGIKPEYILIRLHVEGHPKPLNVEVQDSGFSGPFPWERLDEVPEQYFDRIPQPWPQAENSFTRALTDLGFDKKYTAEFFHDGKIIKKDFKVQQSPPYYGTAPRFKSEDLGMTVRDLTYEIRRYFQKTEQDPGVIVSKIEPGSKASVSGVRPYEIITHVNDKPVMNVKDFEKNIADQQELRLEVKRMAQGRVVKIRMEAATTAPAEKSEQMP